MIQECKALAVTKGEALFLYIVTLWESTKFKEQKKVMVAENNAILVISRVTSSLVFREKCHFISSE